MTENEMREAIRLHRGWMKWDNEDFESDQDLKRPQPLLVKSAGTGEKTALPLDFENLTMEGDYRTILRNRESRRVYSDEGITLRELAFLLWSTQGIRGIRGKNYATLRTVPSGGARHPFETYLAVRHVEGLAPGLYHYLPMEHAVECLRCYSESDPEPKEDIADAVCGQTFVLKASVIFFYSMVPYRGEWRYAHDAHRVMLIDAGHVSENLYLSVSALGLGACAIAALDTEKGSRLFGLDGEEEFMFYAVPVGRVRASEIAKEDDFYAFLKEEEQH